MNHRTSRNCRRFGIAQTVAALVWLMGRSASSSAQPIRPPGPLAGAHATLACAQCHPQATTGKIARNLCLGCHSEIARMITDRHGLHGSSSGPAVGKDCVNCHTEHLGAKADISGWSSIGGRPGFDHARTGFALTGAHRFCAADDPTNEGNANTPCQVPASCQTCHRQPNQRGDLAFAADRRICLSGPCHQDVHAKTVGPDCAHCHDGADAKVRRFDHNRETKFILVGRHQEAAAKGRCSGCHTAGPQKVSVKNPLVFKVKDASCYGCHKADDDLNGHQGTKGQQCNDCHLPIQRYFQDAKGLPAGHERGAQALGGAHDRLPCLTCHTGWRKLVGMGSQCITCHQQDDLHHNSLGPRCGDCHTQQTFAGARFNHDTVGCTLRGIHRILPCADCHKGGNYAGLSPTCVSCHRDDALRAPENRATHFTATRCSGCHTVNSFRQQGASSPPESVCQ